MSFSFEFRGYKITHLRFRKNNYGVIAFFSYLFFNDLITVGVPESWVNFLVSDDFPDSGWRNIQEYRIQFVCSQSESVQQAQRNRTAPAIRKIGSAHV